MSDTRLPGHSNISIHAPRMGSDIFASATLTCILNFNPRSPHGERRAPPTILPANLLFQSTLPAWGATVICYCVNDRNHISIHAPRMGSDMKAESVINRINISIHAPRMGSDRYLLLR